MARDARPSYLAPACLVVGALLGMTGSFVPSASMRGLAWGLDGVALVIASALLAVHCYRRGQDAMAAGFLVFLAGQTLVVSGSAMSLEASAPSFGAGAALWSAGLALISSTPRALPVLTRGLGLLSSVLLAAAALQILAGRSLTPLSQPLPFFAYPFLVLTLFALAWSFSRPTR